MKCSSREAYQLIHEGSIALSKVEAAGVRVDMEYLDKTINDVNRRVYRLEDQMKSNAYWRKLEKKHGSKLKISSRQQLGDLLFKDLGYKVHEYTEKSKEGDRGNWRAKMDKVALDRIKHPYVTSFVEMEGLKKILSTYLDGYKREAVKGRDGCWYVHPVYNLNIASTYRSTANLPNFQNLPKRNEAMWKLARQMLLPHPGHHMVEIDFSTLEVRIAYCYHKDPVMRRYLTDKSTDMHRDMAMQLFKIKEWHESYKKTLRDSSKNQFVFPEFYGSVYFQIAKNIWERMKRDKWILAGSNTDGQPQLIKDYLKKHGIRKLGKCDPQEEPLPGTFEHHVQKVERELWKKFKVYDQWKRQNYEDYQENGFLEMLTGFVVNTNLSRNECSNYGTQGSAFHCLLWCMTQMVNWTEKYSMRSKVVGQVHDSLVCSVHPAELQEFLHRAKWVMQYLLPRHWKWIIIPLETESDVGPVDANWTEVKPWIEDDIDGDWLSVEDYKERWSLTT